MRRYLLFLLFFVVLLIVGQPTLASSPLTLPPDFVDEVVVGGLLSPRAFVFAPDGRIFIAETGKQSSDDINFASIRVFKNGALLTTRALELDTCGDAERGFLGMALDPDFANNGYIYIYYTRQATSGLVCDHNKYPSPTLGPRNRISRVTMVGDTINHASEVILIDNIITDVGYHNAGDLHFDSQGYLYATTGDGGLSENYPTISPDRDTLNGKLLRIKPDNTDPRHYITTGNPYDAASGARTCGTQSPAADPAPSTPNSAPCREVFAVGFRNPFRFAIQSDSSKPFFLDVPFVGDVGGGVWEEIDKITSGGDYGYPSREGPCSAGTPAGPGCNLGDVPPAGLINPIYAYQHVNPNAPSDVPDSAVIGGDFYTGTSYPVQYQNSYFFADFARGFIRQLVYDSGLDTWSAPAQDFATGGNGIIGLKAGPDSNLYYLAFLDTNPPNTHVSEIHRIRYESGVNQKPVARATADKTNGPVPDTIYTFSAAGSYDVDNNLPLVYSWDFDDDHDADPLTNPPSPTSSLTVTHSYADSFNRTVTLTVTDGGGVGAVSDPVTINVYPGNVPPVGTLVLTNQTAPSRTSTYYAGDIWHFDASGVSDPDSGTPPTTSWSIVFHHSSHTHPFIPLATVSGDFQIPYQNFEPATNVWFRVHLSITDSRGQITSIQRDITPLTSSVILMTNPSGGQITVDGANFASPYTFNRVIGMQTTVDAPNGLSSSGLAYSFLRWSNSKPRVYILTVPSMSATYTAYYTTNTPPVRNYAQTEPVILTWNRVGWATGYQIQIDDDPGFVQPLHTSTLLSADTLSYTAPTLPNGVYYWHVRAKKSDGTFGAYGPTESFALVAP